MTHLALLALLAAAPAPAAKTATVLFAGDVTLGFHYEELVDEKVSKGMKKDEALTWGFQKVGDRTRGADLFVANLECPFTARGTKIAKNFNFKARPELVAALSAGGVDVVSLANNHLMDYGAEGLVDTLATLDAAKIRHFGAAESLAQARTATVVEVKGIKLAFLGYFFLGDRNIEPPEVIAVEGTPGVAGHFKELTTLQQWVTEDIKAAKAKADLVIPFFHWGREGFTQPEPYQLTLAHAAIDAGAAAVIGSHPHVLQGMELYKGVPIVYSLGNFVFGGNWNPKDKKTAMVELTVSKKKVESVAVIPAYSDAYPEIPVQPYLAEGDKADEVLRHLATISKTFPKTLPALEPYKTAPDAGESDAGR
jgi:poly-gamma-glutamate capsule biosynthesis protein CapA/YwtB (metallophosphatase superfamily)